MLLQLQEEYRSRGRPAVPPCPLGSGCQAQGCLGGQGLCGPLEHRLPRPGRSWGRADGERCSRGEGCPRRVPMHAPTARSHTCFLSAVTKGLGQKSPPQALLSSPAFSSPSVHPEQRLAPSSHQPQGPGPAAEWAPW